MELESKFEKLIKKQARYESANLGLNLLISRLQRRYSINQSPVELNNCVEEMKAFFKKYPSIIEKDIVNIEKL